MTSEFITKNENFGLPVVNFENLTQSFNPKTHSFFAAVLYTRMNDFRRAIALEAKENGYELATYVSSRAFVWPNVTIGEHCFIFEGNVVQPFAKIGFNNVLWSGNHIGHHAEIGESCFISSHVVISGSTKLIGNTFMGVNSTLTNNIVIGARTWIGPDSLVTKDVPPNSLVTGKQGILRVLDEEILEQKLTSISNSVHKSLKESDLS